MSLTDKILDVAKGQVMKNPLAQEAMKVTETLGIGNLIKAKLTKEETQVQLDLFKKNFENIAKLAKVDGDVTKSVDKAINNKDGFFSELALQWVEKGNYEDNVAKIIKGLQDFKVAKKLPETLDLTGLEKEMLGVAPSTQQIALGAIPLIKSWFMANGSAFKSLNDKFDLINKELQPKSSDEASEDQKSDTDTIAKNNSSELLKDWDGTTEGLQGIATMPLVGGKVKKTGELGDNRGDHKHQGEDYALEGKKIGEIAAPLDMVVKRIDFQKDGAGWYVVGETQAQGKTIETKYMHLAEEPDLNIGDTIKQGQIFAKEGATGGNYGAHLHFEIRIDGELQDPEKMFQAA